MDSNESQEQPQQQNAESVDDRSTRIFREQLERRKELLDKTNLNESNINLGIDNFEFRQRLREEKDRQSSQSQYLFNNAMIAQDYNDDLEQLRKRSSRINDYHLAMMNNLEQKEIVEDNNLRAVANYQAQLSQSTYQTMRQNKDKVDMYEWQLSLDKKERLKSEEYNDSVRNQLLVKNEKQLVEMTNKQLVLKDQVNAEKRVRRADQKEMEEKQQERTRQFFNQMDTWNQMSQANREKRNLERAMQIRRENALKVESQHERNVEELARVNNLVDAEEKMNMNKIEYERRLEDIKLDGEEARQAEIRTTIRELDDSLATFKNTMDTCFVKGYSGNFIFIVLDESGSIKGTSVLEGLNNLIRSQKKQAQQTSVMILKFNDKSKIMLNRENIKNIPELTKQHYIPKRRTALYDSIIEGVELCKKNKAKGEKVYFAIFTDGKDCASKASKEQAKMAIKGLRDWAFVYYGINPGQWSRQMEMDPNYCFEFNTSQPTTNFDKFNQLIMQAQIIFESIQMRVTENVNSSIKH